MMTDKTITVAGHFGDKQMTKQQFADRWVEHAKELRALAWEDEWLAEVDEIEAKVEARAKREFDELWERQNG